MKKLITLLIISIVTIKATAQQTTATAGGEATGTGGTQSYTIGQVVYTTNIGSNGSARQGVQQTYDITIGITDNKEVQLTCAVYPNPTAEVLNLNVGNTKLDNLVFELYDIQGKLLQKQKVQSITTIINMEQYEDANYLLTVTDSNRLIQSFKIIKNN